MIPFYKLCIVSKDQYDLIKLDLTVPLTESDKVILYNNKRVNKSMACIANEMRHINAHEYNEIIGLVHADVVFAPGDLKKCFEAATDGTRIVGIVGRKERRNHWGHEGEAVVSTLDCCSVFWNKNIEIEFDELVFNGFHLYVEDFCLEAKKRNIESFVPALQKETGHVGGSTFNPAWQMDYAKYKERLIQKHPGHTKLWWTTGEFHHEV